MAGVWQHMKKALLVVNYESIGELKKYRKALVESGLNIHECSILAVVSSKAVKNAISEQNSVTFVMDKEISFLGQLKNQEAKEKLARTYDLVFVVGDYSKKMMKIISRTKKTMGVSMNSKHAAQQLNLKTESNSPEHLVNFAKETLQKIV